MVKFWIFKKVCSIFMLFIHEGHSLVTLMDFNISFTSLRTFPVFKGFFLQILTSPYCLSLLKEYKYIWSANIKTHSSLFSFFFISCNRIAIYEKMIVRNLDVVIFVTREFKKKRIFVNYFFVTL